MAQPEQVSVGANQSRLNWREWTEDIDDDPRFNIDNPGSITNLVETAAPEDVVSIEKRYRKLKTPVRCAFCQRHQKHKWGFVVSLRSNRRALMEHNCGDRHLSEKFKRLVNVFEENERKVMYAARIEPLSIALDDVSQILKSWRTSLRTATNFRRQFRELYPDIERELYRAAKTQEGQLSCIVQIRDYAAEESRDALLSDGDRRKGIPAKKEHITS